MSQNSLPSPPAALQTWELRKVYRTGFWLNQSVESLKSCTLTVHQGETFGLLGPNGAGKTTLLKIILGLVRRTAGRATVLGKPLGDRAVRQQIGYLPENPSFYDYLTAWEFLDWVAGLFRLPRAVRQQRLPQLLDLVGLTQKTAKQRKLRDYSKGMLQRVGMAQALIADPDLVFLDEPMSGLDPTGRYRMREIIRQLQADGKTIFFNSHILADVEEICDRIAILAAGELLCVGAIDELLGTSNSYRVRVRGGDREAWQPWLQPLTADGDLWHGQLSGDPQAFLSTVDKAGGQLLSLDRMRLSLEDFFLQTLRDRQIDTTR
ncbi:MAG: ABC transporter ATP-binding protein [Spirulinaceae cyanobacterium SM2_1_0]|nr:ABC transporter ATP-binding protein [Spirulinaceae cyanobacterium SM2_1_0]